jgi:hypothetical protein
MAEMTRATEMTGATGGTKRTGMAPVAGVAGVTTGVAEPQTRARRQATSLADILDRVVDRGVVVSGDVIIQIAGVDLIRLDLRLLLVGIETAQEGKRAARSGSA